MNPKENNPSGRPLNPPSSNTPGTLPAVPLTLDGSAVLHQMFRINWNAWNRLNLNGQEQVVRDAVELFTAFETTQGGGTALFSQLGHKGDLLILHFREGFEDLNQAEIAVANLRLNEYLEIKNSYLSIVELGLYDSTVKLYQELVEEGIQPTTLHWDKRVEGHMNRQAEAMKPRLLPEIPPHRYLCFYPMDKKRGETQNWYTVPIERRRDMMRDHGMIGRKYAGRVKQIISGSIGFDDWEWGVDLFANDPLVFKHLIYEMRFDEASAHYALFGDFFLGLRLNAAQLPELMDGVLPSYTPNES